MKSVSNKVPSINDQLMIIAKSFLIAIVVLAGLSSAAQSSVDSKISSGAEVKQNALLSRFTKNVFIAKSDGARTTLTISKMIAVINDSSVDPQVQAGFDQLTDSEKVIFFERRNAVLTAMAAVLPKVSRFQTFAGTVAEKIKNGVYRVRSQVIEIEISNAID